MGAISTFFIMLFTLSLTLLNGSLAKSTRISADTGRLSLELTQRAYLGIEVKQITPLYPGHHVKFRSEVKNDGNSPAKIVRNGSRTVIATSPPDDPSVTMTKAGYVVGRQATHSTETFDDELTLTQNDIDAIMDCSKVIYFIIEVKYTDVFGKTYVTRQGVYLHRAKGDLISRIMLIPGEKYNYAT